MFFSCTAWKQEHYCTCIDILQYIHVCFSLAQRENGTKSARTQTFFRSTPCVFLLHHVGKQKLCIHWHFVFCIHWHFVIHHISFFEAPMCAVIFAVTKPTTCICKSLSALFPSCFKISCSRFVNVSAREMPGELKTVNEQLPVLGQMAWKKPLHNLPHKLLLKDLFSVHN